MDVGQFLSTMLGRTSARSLCEFLPLVESAYRSDTILRILRASAEGITAGAERALGCRIGVVAFGSLGRLEFVQGVSDLDVLLLYQSSDGAARSPDELRRAVLEPIARTNPWLAMDDRDTFLDLGWQHVSNVDLKYPVYSVAELVQGADAMARCRHWQLLFESRVLYGQGVCEPLMGRRRPLDIVRDAREFFASFENPLLLYKKPSKYWKTRFLREFFVFSTTLTAVLAWYSAAPRSTSVSAPSLAEPVIVKLVRVAQSGAELLGMLAKNKPLVSRFSKTLQGILDLHEIAREPLLVYGEPYQNELASTFYGLLMATLARFVMCWQTIYDPNVLSSLDQVPLTFNPDATVLGVIQDVRCAATVEELISLRKSYRRHMYASVQAFHDLIGVLLHGKTEPRYVTEALRVFEREP